MKTSTVHAAILMLTLAGSVACEAPKFQTRMTVRLKGVPAQTDPGVRTRELMERVKTALASRQNEVPEATRQKVSQLLASCPDLGAATQSALLETVLAILKVSSPRAVSILIAQLDPNSPAVLAQELAIAKGLHSLLPSDQERLVESWAAGSEAVRALVPTILQRCEQIMAAEGTRAITPIVTALVPVLNRLTESEAEPTEEILKTLVMGSIFLDGSHPWTALLEAIQTRNGIESLQLLQADLAVLRTLEAAFQVRLAAELKAAGSDGFAAAVVHQLVKACANTAVTTDVKASLLNAADAALAKTEPEERRLALENVVSLLEGTVPQTDPAGPPPLAATNLFTGRVRFQTRSLVRLSFAGAELSPGAEYSLFSTSLDRTFALGILPARTLLVDGEFVPYFSRTFFRSDVVSGSMFKYGINQIGLRIRGLDETWEVPLTMELRDFPLFDFSLTSFASGSGKPVQTRSGFQGWISPFSNGTVSSGGCVLTSGMGPTINQ